MRRIKLFGLGAGLVLFLTSCPVKTECYTCTKLIVNKKNGEYNSFTEPFCGDPRAIEKEHTYQNDEHTYSMMCFK